MLSWIRNLHTCKTGKLLLAQQGMAGLGPFPLQAEQEQPQEYCCLLITAPMSFASRQHSATMEPCLGLGLLGAMARGTYCLCAGCDPDPLGGCWQLSCLLQDFREGQKIVEEQEPFAL